MDKNKTLKDHRQIGQELDLFSVHEVAPGAIFWHHKGYIIYKTLVEFLRNILLKSGYQEISSPVMVKSELFKMSGHWEFYNEHMFNLLVDKEEYSLKPMNCPEASLIYKTMTRSYNDLPIKYSDFGILHRRELSGVLGGLLRIRQFTIDDAHLFVRSDQILVEIRKLLNLAIDVYDYLDFKPKFYLATKPDKALGDEKNWKEAEKSLEEALKEAKVNYGLKPKEGAFYGPKIDIHIKDSQDRDWQLATIQLDFQIPDKMDLNYINKNGKKERPVMIHRGIFGSLERFIGILLEHFGGELPFWLSPTQIVVIPISNKYNSYAQGVVKQLKTGGLRIHLDSREETMQAKIRDAQLQKIPFMLILGEREVSNNSLSVRKRDGSEMKDLSRKEFLKII